MLDAIAGLSALATGMIAPVSIRRLHTVTEVRPDEEARRAGQQDRLELSPGHIHEEGQTCPICGTVTEVGDEKSSSATAGFEQAATSDEQAATGKPGTQLTPEQEEKVQKLKERDQEVRTHEQAHRAAGGQFSGSPTYTYETGPDGRRYAVDGEVSVDLSPVSGNPQATIAKMQQIRRAALAPARPSGQDRAVAARASQIEAQARAEATRKQFDESRGFTSSSPYAQASTGETSRLGNLIDIAI